MWFPLWALLAAEAWLTLSGQQKVHETVYRFRVAYSALGMVGVSILSVVPETAQA